MKTLSVHSNTNTLAEDSPGAALDGNQLRSAIARLIGTDLAQVNTMLDKQLGSPHPYMADVLNHAGQFRGKQIRPSASAALQEGTRAGNLSHQPHHGNRRGDDSYGDTRA